MHSRSTLLSSRTIYGPVVYLVGGRLTPIRPEHGQRSHTTLRDVTTAA